MRLALAPKAVEVEEAVVEGEVGDVVSIKHCSKMKPDKAQWGSIVIEEVSLRDCIGHRDLRKEDHGEAQHT
jgi:hypothetical protein